MRSSVVPTAVNARTFQDAVTRAELAVFTLVSTPEAAQSSSSHHYSSTRGQPRAVRMRVSRTLILIPVHRHQEFRLGLSARRERVRGGCLAECTSLAKI